MIFRNKPTAMLLIAMSATCAYAKKEPKYEPVHPLTADQHDLVV
jgi:hypothetical protein